MAATIATSGGLDSTSLLSSYVPRDLLDVLSEGVDANGQPYSPEPHFVAFDAAILFVDVSGFTALSNKLSKEGASGSEKLFKNINEYLTKMQHVVEQFKGVLYAFAGDALIVAFKDKMVCTEGQCTITIPALTACQCAHMLQQKCSNFETSAGVTLTLHCAVSVGHSLGCHVGTGEGEDRRLHYVLSSPALADIAAADEQANVGEVMVTPGVWHAVSKFCKGVERKRGCVLLQDVSKPTHSAFDECDDGTQCKLTVKGGDGQLRSRLIPYVPEIVKRLADVTVDDAWMAEQRTVTVAFINISFLLPKSSEDFNAEFFARFQNAVNICQSFTVKYRGFVRQICNDDKGLVFLAIWGMPGLSNEDDSRLATLACLNIHRKLKSEFGQAPNIGITTGHAFCGNVGPSTRHEYTAMGLTVNLAARLMALKMGVVCDEATQSRIRDPTLEFNSLASVVVKGKPEPVAVYQPVEDREKWLHHSSTSGSSSVSSASESSLIGRSKELELMKETLKSVIDNPSKPQCMFLEGAPGVGKSLLAEILMAGAPNEVTCVSVRCAAAEQATALFPVGAVVRRLLVENDLVDMRGHITYPRLQRLIPDIDGLREEAWLLSEIIPIDGEDKGPLKTKPPTLEQRRTRLPALVNILAQELARRAPVLAVFEDGQWMDSASLSALSKWLSSDCPFVIVFVQRPMADTPTPAYTELRYNDNATVLSLGPLSSHHIHQVVKAHTGVDKLKSDVKSLITEVCRGNPLFAIELTDSLMSSKTVIIKDDALVSTVPLNDVSTPHTLQGIFTQRIDSLPANDKFVLKLASVLGQLTFVKLLIQLHPLGADDEAVHQSLHGLLDRDLLEFEARAMRPDDDDVTEDFAETREHLCCTRPEGFKDLKIVFKHMFVQEVAYNLMSEAQRRELHLQCVRYVQHLIDNNVCRVKLQSHVAYIAYHWDRAIGRDSSDADRRLASKWLADAGEAALAKGAVTEGLHYLSNARKHMEGLEMDRDFENHVDCLLVDAISTTTGAFNASAPAQRIMRSVAKKVFGDEERYLTLPSEHEDEKEAAMWLAAVPAMAAYFGNKNDSESFNYILEQVMAVTRPRFVVSVYLPCIMLQMFRGNVAVAQELQRKYDEALAVLTEQGETVRDTTLNSGFRISVQNVYVSKAYAQGDELGFCDHWAQLEAIGHDRDASRQARVQVAAVMGVTALLCNATRWAADLAHQSLDANPGNAMKYMHRMASFVDIAQRAYNGKSSYREAVYDILALLGTNRGLAYYPILIDMCTKAGEYERADLVLGQWKNSADHEAYGLFFPEYFRLQAKLLYARTRYPLGKGISDIDGVPDETEQPISVSVVEQMLAFCDQAIAEAKKNDLVVLLIRALATATFACTLAPLPAPEDPRRAQRQAYYDALSAQLAREHWKSTSLFDVPLEEGRKALEAWNNKYQG